MFRKDVLNLYNLYIADLIFCIYLPGDEILEVNGESLQGLTHQEAIQRFKVTWTVALKRFTLQSLLSQFDPLALPRVSVCRFSDKCWSPHCSSVLCLQQLKKGVVTLTVRTRLRSPSLTPCVTPTLLSRSSSPSASLPAPGLEEPDGSSSSRKGPGPKDRIVMDVTLNKGEGPSKRSGRADLCFLGALLGKC